MPTCAHTPAYVVYMHTCTHTVQKSSVKMPHLKKKDAVIGIKPIG